MDKQSRRRFSFGDLESGVQTAYKQHPYDAYVAEQAQAQSSGDPVRQRERQETATRTDPRDRYRQAEQASAEEDYRMYREFMRRRNAERRGGGRRDPMDLYVASMSQRR